MNPDIYLNTSTQTLAWFRKRIQADEIELRPAFQREGVWTDRQKSYLIDTMLKGLPVPEMYLQENIDEAGNEKFIVVDGQQRLRACMQFIEGDLTLVGDELGNLAGLKIPDLEPEQRQALFAYTFVVRKLPPAGEEVLRDIFRRINKNTVTLNNQEIRHATYWGEFIKCAELIANHASWSGLGVFTPNDIRRMRHVEFVSEVIVARLYGDQDKKRNLEQAYTAFESRFEQRETIQNSLLDALQWFEMHFEGFSRTRWRKKSDFYSLWIVASKIGYGSDRLPKGVLKQPGEIVDRLQRFGESVDAYLRHAGDTSDLARKYAKAVDRAASDIANRRARREALEELLEVSQVYA